MLGVYAHDPVHAMLGVYAHDPVHAMLGACECLPRSVNHRVSYRPLWREAEAFIKSKLLACVRDKAPTIDFQFLVSGRPIRFRFAT